MTRDLDTILREYGERWRDSVPVGEPELDGLGAPRRWVLPVVAAAVVASIGIGVGVTRLGGEDSTTPPTNDPPVVVPWAELEPTYPHFPTRTEPVDRDPAVAALAPPCLTGDLIAERLGDEIAVLTFVLRAKDEGTRCRLQGSPEVEFRTDRRPVDIPIRRAQGDHQPVLIADGLSATINFFWGLTACFEPPVIEVIHIPLADGVIAVEGFGEEPCLAEISSTAVSPVRVGAFIPRETERPVSAYDGVTASLASEPVRQGDDLTFIVEVTATEHDLPLEPCPDHSLRIQNSWDDFTVFPHALNCGDVPFRDEEGAPYLPVGVPVRFELVWDLAARYAVNAEGAEWRLELPAPVDLELPALVE